MKDNKVMYLVEGNIDYESTHPLRLFYTEEAANNYKAALDEEWEPGETYDYYTVTDVMVDNEE